MLKKNLWYLFLFFLPWQSRAIFWAGNREYLSYSLYALDLLLLLLVFLYWKEIKASLIYFWKEKRRALYFLLALDLLVFSSIFWAEDPYLSAYKYLWFLEAELLFFLAWRLFKKSFYFSFYAFSAGALFQALLALSQFAQQRVFSSTWLGIALQDPYIPGTAVLETGLRLLRVYGSFSHPNILGGFLAGALLILLYLWLQRSHQFWYYKKSRLFSLGWVVIYAIVFSALLLTFSRSAFLAFLLSSGFLSFYRWKDLWPKEKFSQRHFLLIGLVFLPIWLAISFLWAGRFDNTNRLELISINERLSGLEQAREIISFQPWGVSWGNYSLALERLVPDQAAFYYQPVHNSFLLFWAELGFLGLIFLFLFLFFLFSKEKSPFRGAVFFLLLPLLFFDHWLFSLHFGLFFFWLFLAWRDEVVFLQEK